MGGSTFVSRSLAEHFIYKGFEVDILTRGLGKIPYYGFRDHLVCDRQSRIELQKTLDGKQYEYIFDISAYTKDDVSALLSSINTTSLKKYIFCSTAAVYKPDDSPRSENDERGANPHWGKYGFDKKEAEDYLFHEYLHKDFPVIIFRPAYIYGENNNLYRESYFFDRLKENKVIPIPYGNDTRVQFIHIVDLCNVFESAMTTDAVGKAYNVSHPELISWENLIECCSKAVGVEAAIKLIDHRAMDVEARTFFPFHDVDVKLDIASLISSGLYIPSIRLSDGIQRTYNWYLNHSPRLTDGGMNRVDEV
ncbi:NAD-dependent epimerase/dehydratase family protein [Paenibacillus sp. sptzw28]|uniref:NAD-dependent epimerase/dehydratase family protein n=1 Tax=Paenibacillus sp. sptzw28 TaxID=715179 RepID=UPI001C6F276B|nr:NAD-dependent epimerase/dehydratase family protein [Paenibacillus sp. sptzw28]QYR22550.1 NAD-dependent epimerase/dehydratase family protein [Paenibacillus sp. sptzw28]